MKQLYVLLLLCVGVRDIQAAPILVSGGGSNNYSWGIYSENPNGRLNFGGTDGVTTISVEVNNFISPVSSSTGGPFSMVWAHINGVLYRSGVSYSISPSGFVAVGELVIPIQGFFTEGPSRIEYFHPRGGSWSRILFVTPTAPVAELTSGAAMFSSASEPVPEPSSAAALLICCTAFVVFRKNVTSLGRK